MSSPLILERHCFTEVSLVATKADSASGDFEVTARQKVLNVEEDPRIWAIALRVEIKPAAKGGVPPYTGAVSVFGNFRVAVGYPEDGTARMVATNGTSILYGAARELVANITARGPHPMITLPSISFVPTEKEMEGSIPAAPPAKPKAAKKKTSKRS